MTEQHDQYFTYREKTGATGLCIMCKEPTSDFLAYSPPGIVVFERPCCRGCVNVAYDTVRELVDGLGALGRTLGALRGLFGLKG